MKKQKYQQPGGQRAAKTNTPAATCVFDVLSDVDYLPASAGQRQPSGPDADTKGACVADAPDDYLADVPDRNAEEVPDEYGAEVDVPEPQWEGSEDPCWLVPDDAVPAVPDDAETW